MSGAPPKSEPANKVYAVIIDAGSSGSRVVGYEFEKEGEKFLLKREQFNKTRPGLSSFADDVDKGAQNITNLLSYMKDFVPQEKKKDTILYLRATAGLRLLGDEKAGKLLQAVQKVFETTGYSVTNDSADMLNGTDEGIMAWFTLNYLKKTLDNGMNTFATLEMGGASAQVTFVPKERYIPKLEGNIYQTPDGKRKVFSKSYLGLGLNGARNAIFQKDSKTLLGDRSVVCSRCLNIRTSEKFKYNNTEYSVHGKARKGKKNGINIEKCRDHVKAIISEKVDPKPLSLAEEKSVSLGAFYYRGVAGELLTGTSGKSTVKGLWDKAQSVCNNPTKSDPFLCMDLIYIHTLLKEGYQLNDTNNVEMIFNIDNHELSWALGFAYSKLIAPSGPGKKT